MGFLVYSLRTAEKDDSAFPASMRLIGPNAARTRAK